MKITSSIYGIIGSESIHQYTLEHNDIKVSLLSYGASISQIIIDNCLITLSLPYAKDWERNSLYTGATLAPNAGRISNATLPLCGNNLSLSQNDHGHQLHGGLSNLSFCNWKLISSVECTDFCSVTLGASLPDGMDGYPGNRQFSVCYTLTQSRCLSVHYAALTDKATYINMSNHTYFNLSGDFGSSVLLHKLQLNAGFYTELEPDHIPRRLASCASTPFDFRTPCTLASKLKKYPHHPQTEIGNGYNHGFIHNAAFPSSPALILTAPDSAQVLKVYTDAPCIVLYSGGFIEKGLPLKDGNTTAPSCALAIECQDIPDTPNFLPLQTKATTPEHPFTRTVVYQFL